MKQLSIYNATFIWGESVLEKKNCVKFIKVLLNSFLRLMDSWNKCAVPFATNNPPKKSAILSIRGLPRIPPLLIFYFLPHLAAKQSKRERHLLNFPFTSDIVSLICSFLSISEIHEKKRRPSSHYIKVYSFLVQMSRRNLLPLRPTDCWDDSNLIRVSNITIPFSPDGAKK